MINSKFKVKKLLKLAGMIWFYSYSILILYCIFTKANVSSESIFKCVLPILYSQYWFMTTYVVIYILSNYINKFLKSISQKEYIILMMILLGIWSVLPTIIDTRIGYSNIDWFILIYMIGAYIKIYEPKWIKNQKRNILSLIALLAISAISVLLLNKIYDILGVDPLRFISSANQLIGLMIAILIFIIFNNINIKTNKIINKISSCTLGIYLIHTHILLRDVIWYNIYNIPSFTESKYLVLYEIFVIITLYVACVCIELIRQNTIEKLYMKLIDKLEGKYQKIFLHLKKGGQV